MLAPARAGDPVAEYKAHAAPVLDEFCARCHSAESAKGGVSFEFGDADPASDPELWLKTLRMMRSGMMPPKGKDRPSAEELAAVEKWVKYSAFGTDPRDPDPGRVTLRRLNRTEYRNTVRDLLGVEFDAAADFPADDTGHGFDTVAEVLTLSPLLVEKYLAAAKSAVVRAVPTAPWVPAERRIAGGRFATDGAKPSDGPLVLSYTKAAVVRHEVRGRGRGQVPTRDRPDRVRAVRR